MKIRLFLLGLPLIFFACQSGYKQDSRGYEYKVYSSSKSKEIKPGSYLEGTQTVYLVKEGGDSVLEASQPFNMRLDTAMMGMTAPFMFNAVSQILLAAGKADSISVIALVDSLQANAPFLKKGDKIRFDIRIKEVLDEKGFAKKQEEKEKEQEKRRLEMVEKEGVQTKIQLLDYTSMLKSQSQQAAADSTAIVKWLKENKITNANRTASGLYYLIEDPGQGDSILPFQRIKVEYTGRLLNGKGFDSSAVHGPYEFVIGDQRSAIMGWQEGLLYFKNGGKGKLIIPSYLAYGDQGAGEDIPANSPLVFDIEVVEVK